MKRRRADRLVAIAGWMSWRVALLLAAASFLARMPALAFAGVAHKPPACALLYPPDSAVVLKRQVQLIVIAHTNAPIPVVKLNGASVRLERKEFAAVWMPRGAAVLPPPSANPADKSPNKNPLLQNKAGKAVFLAVVNLKAGRNLVETAGKPTRLFHSRAKEAQDAPAGWPIFHPHPGVPDTNQPIACATCHAIQPGESALGRPKLPDACQVCHVPVDLRLIHSHVMDPLSNCLLCHNPHGSTLASLLIGPQEKLCTQCHEGGHSRN